MTEVLTLILAGGKGTRLDPLTREIIALAVSATNSCHY